MANHDIVTPSGGASSKPELGVPFRISWIARLQTQRFDARAKGVGLTRAQWRVIATVALRQGVTQSYVASQLEVTNVTAGRIIDRLEEMRYLERRVDPDDRRVNRLFLTDAAAPVLDRLGDVGAQEEAAELRGLSDAEREQLVGLLDRLIDNMNGDTETGRDDAR